MAPLTGRYGVRKDIGRAEEKETGWPKFALVVPFL